MSNVARFALAVAALACAFAGVARAEKVRGPIVLQGRPFELATEHARAFAAPEPGAKRVSLAIAGAPAADPLARCGIEAERFVLDPSSPDAAQDRALATAIGTASAIDLSGGKFLDWFKALTPARKPTRAARALVDARRRGVPIACAGGAAEFAAAYAPISREALEKPSRDPHEPDVDLAVPGLGLVEDLCIAVADDAAASCERLFATVARFGPARAALLAGEVAWIVGDSGWTSVRGAGCVIVIDFSGAVRDRRFVRHARVSALADGDRLALDPHVEGDDVGMFCPGPASDVGIESSDAFSARAWLEAATELARVPRCGRARFASREWDVTLSTDCGSLMARSARARRMRLDVEFRR